MHLNHTMSVAMRTEDIILEGKKGLYDAVVLARHAVELLDQTFSTSVSREILNHKLE